MSARIKCGVVGAGVIAPAHIESLQLLPDVEVSFICDLIEEKARAVSQKYGIDKIGTDYREMLDDKELDCICVCTDHASHSPITVDALDSGKHVICEKSLAASLAGLDAMLEAHKRNPNQVFCGVFQHRFDQVFRYLKSLIDEDALGTVLTAGINALCFRSDEYYQGDKWRGTWNEEGGSVLINQAIHYLDLLNWISGGIESLGASYQNLTHQESIETEDTATASVKFKSGALGTVSATCSSHLGWDMNIGFYGTEGSVEIRNGELVRVMFKDPEREQEVKTGFSKCKDLNQLNSLKSYYGSGHPGQLADFINAVRQGTEPFVTGESAAETVKIVMAIYRSHREKRQITI
jgi:predicted dehydrogenase